MISDTDRLGLLGKVYPEFQLGRVIEKLSSPDLRDASIVFNP